MRITDVITACNKLRGDFLVDDVVLLMGVEVSTENKRMASAELCRLRRNGVLADKGKQGHRCIFSAPAGLTVLESYSSWRHGNVPDEPVSENIQPKASRFNPNFLLHGVRMKRAKEHFYLLTFG